MPQQVLPPANGKKLWRVKRAVSSHSRSDSADSISSLECLNNSLKISNAAKFTMKRPPLRRPKNKPGMAKDFVFVDLSPVKSEEVEEVKEVASESESVFDQSFVHSSPQSSIASPDCLGLGIMGLDWNEQLPVQEFQQSYPQYTTQDFQQAPSFSTEHPTQFTNNNVSQQLLNYQEAMLQQSQQIQFLQQQLQQVQSNTPTSPKRTKSRSEQPSKRRSSGQFQFKTYTGPKNKVKKPSVSSVGSVSPVSPRQVGLEDFFTLNEQLAVPLNANDFMNQLSFSGYDDKAESDQFLLQRQDELFMGFVI